MKKPVLFAGAALALASGASAQTIVGLTVTDSLFTVQASAPGTITGKVAVTGLGAGQSLAGMDYRPATNELFALGYNSSTNVGQLYTVNVTTGALTAVGSSITLALGTGSIGFDFNPTVDRIRLVGANRNNYRLNPITGGIAAQDGALTYAAGDPNVLSTPSIGAAAYTNSYPLLTTTALYYYDEALNNLVLSSSPNTGTLNTVGSSGITINASSPTTDLDISFNPSTKQNTAYFVANTSGQLNDNLYTVNLTTGSMTQVGAMGLAVKDIAVQPIMPTPGTLTGRLVYALAGTRSLVSFDSNNPEQLRSMVAISGVDSALTLVGMDFRPADGSLYALGYRMGSSPNTYRLYTVNRTTGAATPINSGADTMALGNTMEIGFDFNPTVDRIRVVSAQTRANYRLNPATGLVAATDTALTWMSGDANASRTVRLSTVAYTNSYPGATTTTMNGVNDSGAVFVTVPAPNGGRLMTVQSSIFGSMMLNGTTELDYFYDSTTSTNIGYLAANTTSPNVDVLYTLSATGTPTMVDTIGYGFNVTDIAVLPLFRNAPQTNSIAAAGMASAVAVYPNPVAGILRVVLPAAAGTQTVWTVSDLSGRSLLRGTVPAGAQATDVPVQGLATGLYLMTVDGQLPVRFSKL